MKKIFLTLVLYLFTASIIAQIVSTSSPDWVRVGPKGYALDAKDKYKFSGNRILDTKFCPIPSAQNPTIFVLTYLGLFKTTDKGNNFTPINNFNNSSWSGDTNFVNVNDCLLSEFIVSKTDPNFLVVAQINNKLSLGCESKNIEANTEQAKQIKIFKTTNQGTSWIAINSGLVPDVTTVYKFVFSPDEKTLFACTNYGLWKSTNIKSDVPTWSLVDLPPTNDYMNISDLIYTDVSTPSTWTIYVASDQIYTQSSENTNTWTDITSDTKGKTYDLSIMKTCYLAYTNNTLIAKVYADVYFLNNKNRFIVPNGFVNSSLKNVPNDGVMKTSLAQYDLYKCTINNSKHSWVGKLNIDVSDKYNIDYSLYFLAFKNKIFLARDYIFTVDLTEFNSAVKSIDYFNDDCSASHADVTGMAYNSETNEIYFANHGGFSIYNTTNTSTDLCQRMTKLDMEGLPGGIINSASSSPFTNGELVYSIWDNLQPNYYQVGDIHYVTDTKIRFAETNAPNFYVADKVFLSTSNEGLGNTSYFDFSNSNTKCYEFVPNQNMKITDLTTYMRQIKPFLPLTQGKFYYINNTQLFLVSGLLHSDQSAITAINNQVLKFDIAQNSIYNGYIINSFQVVSQNILYLSLTSNNQTNILLKTIDGGTTWVNINLPTEVQNFSEGFLNVPSESIRLFSKPVQTSINKVVIDPNNSKKIYLVIGNNWGNRITDNVTSIYYSENEGNTWVKVFYQFADLDNTDTPDYVTESEKRPKFPNNYLKGLPVNNEGILWASFNDFDVNPNTGDPILVSNFGVFYKKDGFFSTNTWARYLVNNQPRNSRFIDINTFFNKMYVSGNGGVFCGDIPCYNNNSNIVISSFVNNTTYQTSETITSSVAVPTNQTEILRAGKSITFNTGFSAYATSGNYFKAFVSPCSYSTNPFKDVRVKPEMVDVDNVNADNWPARIEEMKNEELIKNSLEIKAYPNPSPDIVKISAFEKEQKLKKLVLRNVEGHLLFEKELDVYDYEIDLRNYNGNSFILDVILDSGRKTVKLIKFNPTSENKNFQRK